MGWVVFGFYFAAGFTGSFLSQVMADFVHDSRGIPTKEFHDKESPTAEEQEQ